MDLKCCRISCDDPAEWTLIGATGLPLCDKHFRELIAPGRSALGHRIVGPSEVKREEKNEE